ncbi:MAG: hypothetical protein QOG33_2154 [Gaiellales bacterium]|nr:hypothetical protein [Gaiellales bacterium]
MSDPIEQLFQSFAQQHEAGGEVDVVDYLDRAGDQRSRLADMLEAYLVARPRAAIAEAELDTVSSSLEDAASWPELLPMLREQRGITRGGLVQRLADALGFPDATKQVEGYVHELESGELDPRHVRERVVTALAGIFSVSTELLEQGRLRQTLGLRFESSTTVAFLRQAPAPSPAAEPLFEEPAAGHHGEIDDLFTGGDV